MTIPFWDEWEDIPAELFESLREADKSVENKGPIKLDVSVLEILGALWLEGFQLDLIRGSYIYAGVQDIVDGGEDDEREVVEGGPSKVVDGVDVGVDEL